MDEIGTTPRRGPRPAGFWGKWRGVTCSHEGCAEPVTCKGFCNVHYQKAKWAGGHRAPSVNTEAQRERHRRYRYGIEPADYEALVLAQGGVCAICQHPPTPGKRMPARWGGGLAVDHCHGSKRVRGLLCNDCNLVVGRGATPEILERAAQYLRDHDRRDPVD